MKYLCAVCGTTTDSIEIKCPKCGSAKFQEISKYTAQELKEILSSGHSLDCRCRKFIRSRL